MLATVPLQGNKNVVFFRLRHEHFAVRFLHCQLGFWAASSAFLCLNTIIKGNERSPVNQQGAKKCRYYWGYLSNISDCSWTQRQEEISASKFTSSLGVHCIIDWWTEVLSLHFQENFPYPVLDETFANNAHNASQCNHGSNTSIRQPIWNNLTNSTFYIYMRVFPFVVVTT